MTRRYHDHRLVEPSVPFISRIVAGIFGVGVALAIIVWLASKI